MNFLDKRSLKSKLFILAGVPSIAFLILSVYFLIYDYERIDQIKKARENLNLMIKIDAVVTQLRENSNLETPLQNKDEGVIRESSFEKNNIDALVALKAYAKRIGNSQINDELKEKLAKFIGEVEFFFKNPQTSDIQERLARIQLQGIHTMAEVASGTDKEGISDKLFAYLSLFEVEVTNGLLQNLLDTALKAGEFSKKNYEQFRTWVGMQYGFEEMFRVSASPNELALYETFLKQPTYLEADQIIEKVLNRGAKGPFEIDAEAWKRAQSSKIMQLNAIEENILKSAEEISQKDLLRNFLNFYGTLIALVILLLIIFFIGRTIFKNILLPLKAAGKLANQVGTEVSQILASISETSAATMETAAAVTETTSTSEELKQTAQVAVEKAKDVSEYTSEAFQVLKSSETSLDATVDGMNKIRDGMKTISESILKLSEKCKAIGEIIDTVNDLAQQSNLLAVNAAIEAAKAGDQGKGFGVVAQEVRSLAEQSKQATVQVRSLLSDIQNATNTVVLASEQGSKAVANGMACSGETSQSIHSLSAGVTRMSQAATQISTSNEQQLIGIAQVNEAMTQIKEATDHYSDRIKQIEEAVQSLHAGGVHLQKLVERLGL